MSYTTLKANIQNYLENDSSELVDSIDVIIAQAEEMVFQRLPNLPCFRNSFTGTLVVGQADYTPTTGTPSIRMIRQVAIVSSGNVIYLDHRIDSYLRDYWPNSSTTGTPIMYSTKTAADVGSGSVTTITLAPTPSATLAFQVDFIGKPVGLSSTNANTWIDTNATDVLLSAALYEASAFLKAPETLKLYKGKFDEAVQLFSQEMGRNYSAEYNGGI